MAAPPAPHPPTPRPPGGTARVAVVQHTAVCPPARVGTWLSEAGCTLDVFRGYAGDGLPEDLRPYAGLLVLGGEMGAYDDATHPWLTGTKTLLARALDAELPTLAICLGLQLLAVACGGAVAPSPTGPQIGVRPVGLDAAAADDPLLSGLACGPTGQQNADHWNAVHWNAVHWNNDVVVELPLGATVVARSDGHPQALRLGAAAWGVQFHPEVDADTLRLWAEADVVAGLLDASVAEERLAAAAALDAELVATWSGVTHRFAALVAARADQASETSTLR